MPRDEKQRIESDIQQFYENVREVPVTPENEEILSLARQYCEDTKYFLEKDDLITAFGCINYAHGLLDALRNEKFSQKFFSSVNENRSSNLHSKNTKKKQA